MMNARQPDTPHPPGRLLPLTLRKRRRLAAVAGVLAVLAGDVWAAVSADRVPSPVSWLALGLALLIWRDVRGNRRSTQAIASIIAADRASIDQLRAVVEAAQARTDKRSTADRDHLEKRLSALAQQVGTPDQRVRKVEALLNLYTVLRPTRVMPPTNVWVAPPELVLHMANEIMDRRPQLVVECGSGSSTLWLAYALRQAGSGRVVALEHDERFAAQTRQLLAEHGLSDVAEVRSGALEEIRLGDETWQFYPAKSTADLTDIGLLFVDGPPQSIQPLSRYPALPVFADRMAPDGMVLLDDAMRPDEEAILKRWAAEYPVSVRRVEERRGGVVRFDLPAEEQIGEQRATA